MNHLLPGFKRSKSEKGRDSRKDGLDFQKAVQDQAEALGILIIPQEPEHSPFSRSLKGQILYIRKTKGWVDFIAVLPDGRTAHFDCKTCSDNTSWNVGEKLKEPNGPKIGHQLRSLRKAAALGHPAFALVRRLRVVEGFVPVVVADYVVPVGELGFTSRVWSKLEKWKIPSDKTWIDAVAQWKRYQEEGWT